MALKVANNATGRLAVGISDVDTSLSLHSSEGARFPTLSSLDFFYATLQNTAGDIEIIKVTGRSGDTFTSVVRAQDGTIALPFDVGTIVSLRPTKAVIEYLQTGTPINTFQVGLDASGPKLANAAGDLYIRNAADTNYVVATVRQLVINDSQPSAANHATRKDYVDSLVASSVPPGTKMYFYQNTAPAGWTIDSAVSDALLAVKGGGQAFSVNGGVTAGSWTQPNHAHTGPSHSHTGPSHSHDLNNHSHIAPSHTHAGPAHSHDLSNHKHIAASHSHSVPAHTHGFSATTELGIDMVYYSPGVAGDHGSALNHKHAVSGTTASGGGAWSGSAGDLWTTGPDVSVTGVSGTGDTSASGNAYTSGPSVNVTGLSGTNNTGESGTGSTGASATANTYRPFAAVGIIATKN